MRGVATGEGSAGEARIGRLGAIELGSILNQYKIDVFTKKKKIRQTIELTKNLAPRPRTTSCEEGTSRALADQPWPCCLGKRTAPSW